MVYSTLRIMPTSGVGLSQPLNKERDGWVCQILNGTFGSAKEYNFTGNVVTTVTDKPIDINVRLTPTVPVPKKSVRSYLDILSNSNEHTVTLFDDSTNAPTITYARNETTTYTKPTVSFNRNVSWEQTCVVREIKYNYSDNPATIEFTLTTKSPVLYGPGFTIYVGLGNQNWAQSVMDAQAVIYKLDPLIGYVDIQRLRVGLPPVGNTKYQLFNNGLTQFHAYLEGSSTTDRGIFDMTKSPTGGRLFNITGGYQALSSTCYASEAYPYITMTDIIKFISTVRQLEKFSVTNYGSCFMVLDLVMVRKGL